MSKFVELKTLVENVEKDYEKAMAGNKAASVRVRKAMKEVKDLAHFVRNTEMLEARKKD